MESYLVEMLQCPACQGPLAWSVAERRGGRIEEAEARCTSCGATYPVREGIGVFLTPDLPRNDLWEEVESGLGQYLRANPETARLLLETPLAGLSPADQFYSAMALEERGEYARAAEADRESLAGLYTPAYLSAWRSQIAYVAAHVRVSSRPVVDLASGRGILLEELAREPGPRLVGTDFSLRALRHDRHRFAALGLGERVSWLAFDARRTPFRDGSVATLTTNLGLPNIENPGALASELRRIVSGSLLAISHFYPPDDAANAAAIAAFGLEQMLHRSSALAALQAAGWQVELANVTPALARPTPSSTLIPGAGIDGLPVAETTLEWCTLFAV